MSSARRLAMFMAGTLPALLFALFTRHAWEDWFITYRAARNLAFGNGLVYEPGQSAHTFTSPLNVLIPAGLCWFTGGRDPLVLWLYRLLGAALLGATLVLLYRIAVREGLARHAQVFLLAFVALDGKLIDFTINGQEAAFVAFFLTLSVVALLERRWALLGVAWAGIMWSRPDGFVFAGGVALGYVVRERAVPVALLARATLLAALLYSPWLLWTTWYYGTPVPHSVVAKGLGRTLPPILSMLAFPVTLLREGSVLDGLFTPPYAFFGGWPAGLMWLSRLVGWVCCFLWLVPRAPGLARMASVGVCCSAFYLQYIAAFPFPWYFPPVELLSALVLAAIVPRKAVPLVLAGWAALTVLLAWEMRVQQAVIESGLRRPLGLWLKEQSQGARSTVFLECVGYIGFFSNLKTYDFPGMTSPEVVAARRAHGNQWPSIVRALKPDWLVLRPLECELMTGEDATLLTEAYQRVAEFDRTQDLARVAFLPGRGYLEHDQCFWVFRRQAERGGEGNQRP